MRLVTVVLFLFLLSVSVWAGTFKDDFEDEDWKGWEIVAPGSWNTDVADRFSFEDGVLRMDNARKPEIPLFLYIMGNWRDYCFSADMRIIEVELGTA